MLKEQLIKKLTITGVGLVISYTMQVAVRRLINKFMEGKLPTLHDVDEYLVNDNKYSAFKAYVIIVSTEMGILLSSTGVAVIVQYMIHKHWPIDVIDLDNGIHQS